MALKVIQDVQIPRLSPSAGVAITSVPIALKTGYLRITIGATSSSYGGYVSIGTNPTVNRNSFHVVPYGTDILKEGMKRQKIAGITTGATTTVTFDNNAGNPFVATDYVTIEGATTSGINTTHNTIVSLTDSSVTLNFDSSSVTNVSVGAATLVKSVKVACLTDDVNSFFNISEVVTLVSE
jgi:hypothetical protein